MKRLHLSIHGRVQGVFFRSSAADVAHRLGVTGWIRNCQDGRVETIAEGEHQALKKFKAWCEHGPPRAKVDRVEERWSESKDAFADFEIRRD